jgi:hypothetical protein
LQLEVSLPGNPSQTARTSVRIDHEQMSVRLIQPAPDTMIAPGSTVQLLAETSGPVTRVEFIVDGQVIGGTAGAATSWNWRATGRGRHTLEAAVYNADGQRVLSAPVVVLVE